MAMPQTQGPGPAHALSYLSRPMWDPTSTLMLDTNTESDEMERGKSWEEAYDPFSHFHITDSSGNDHLLFPTPVSQSGPYQRLSPMPSQIPQSMPSSQAGSYSSASYPSSESYRFERAGSLFSQQSVKMEDPLDWTSNSQPEFPPRGTSTEPELFISPGVIYDPRSVVQSPAPQESRLPTPSGSGLGKHGRDDAFMEQSPRLTIEESKRGTTKRRRTPRENANWLCDICDMPFERPYNLKAHLETHDPNRQKPFKCEHEGCSREFVRKTDLTRHVQSVRACTELQSYGINLLLRFTLNPRIGYACFASKASRAKILLEGQLIILQFPNEASIKSIIGMRKMVARNDLI
ncbi:MAG: hypothetical protein Q9157_001896 [Trypethelium eluteriae]